MVDVHPAQPMKNGLDTGLKRKQPEGLTLIELAPVFLHGGIEIRVEAPEYRCVHDVFRETI
jgi:hypothetical protein